MGNSTDDARNEFWSKSSGSELKGTRCTFKMRGTGFARFGHSTSSLVHARRRIRAGTVEVMESFRSRMWIRSNIFDQGETNLSNFSN